MGESGAFRNSDITVCRFVIYQSLCSVLWGSRQGILFICLRLSNITAFSCVWDNFENAPRMDADIFDTAKKRCVSKISGYVWTGPRAGACEKFCRHFMQFLQVFLEGLPRECRL